MDNLRYQTYLKLEHSLRQHLGSYGYIPKHASLIQPAELFLTRAGDQIIEKLFTFTQNGKELSLRPEFTSIAAYQYTQEKSSNKPVRWQFSGKIFENKAQSQYQQELNSIGAELIGSNSVEADAEIISMAYGGLTKAIADTSTLVIGHVGLLRYLLEQFHLDKRTSQFLLRHREELKNPEYGKAYVLNKLEKDFFDQNDKEQAVHFADSHTDYETSTSMILRDILQASEYAHTMGSRNYEDITRRLLHKHNRTIERENIVHALDFLEQWISIKTPIKDAFAQIETLIQTFDSQAKHLFTSWKQLIAQLELYNLPINEIEIQTDLARDWNYYTGIVFGVRSQSGEYILGGGRYDELISLVSNDTPTPAVGFAYYIDTLLDESISVKDTSSKEIFYLHSNHENLRVAISTAQHLRNHGYAVILQHQESEQNVMSISMNDDKIIWNQQEYANIEELLPHLKAFSDD